MTTKPCLPRLGFTVACLLAFSCLYLGEAFPVTLGQVYDQTNWEELKGYGPPPLVNWVRSGEFLVKPVPLEFDWKITDKKFLQATQSNEGKFDLDDQGYIVYRDSRKRPQFIYGFPFPTIDPTNPKAGAMVLANFNYLRYRQGGAYLGGRCSWVGKGGKEREVVLGGDFLYFQGRPDGPIKNPSNFLEQQINFVFAPFDLRGVVQMLWIYDDDRPSTMFAYVPMLRRIRRVSPAARSNPFLGSDFCTDDTNAWTGKNQTMEWKLIGEGTILAPFSSPSKHTVTPESNGTLKLQFPQLRIGFMDKEWKGAPWAPIDMAWHPLEVWIVEAFPKDPYYNYGRQLFYVDKSTYSLWYKEIYDRSGEYWKTVFTTQSFFLTDDGCDTIGANDYYFGIDDKTDHATYCDQHLPREFREWAIHLPEDVLGPDHFTESTLMQISK